MVERHFRRTPGRFYRGRVSTTSTPDRIGAGVLLASIGILAVQFGAAVADGLILLVGALGAVALRQAVAAVVLAGTTRPWRRRWSAADLRRAGAYAAVFVGMNLLLYAAISRLPLATAITLEFLGPLAVAILTAKGVWPRIWAIPAGVGVLMIGGGLSPDDLVGVLCALGAATCWALYILIAERVGRAGDPLPQLTMATGMAAAVLVPVAAVTAGPALWALPTLWLGVIVGVLSSVIPYSLDLLALQRLPTAVFGILTSLNPAAAALAGVLVLHQVLPVTEFVGIGLVVLASAGVTLTARRLTAP